MGHHKLISRERRINCCTKC